METIINKFGEQQTSWTSHKHPNNPDFMQVVKYTHIVKSDGKTSLHWSLFNASSNDNHVIPNITLEEAKSRFTDVNEKEITEENFQKWLNEKKHQ
jgi:hypothetical protein